MDTLQTFPDGAAALTRRERQVLELLLAEKRDKEIAVALGISLRTVEKHVEHLRRKFGARSRRELVCRSGRKNT